MNICKNLTLATLAATLLAAHAGPIEPTNVPKSSDWYVHVNLDALTQGKLSELIQEIGQEAEDEGESNPLDFMEHKDGQIAGGITVFGSMKNPDKAVIRVAGMKEEKVVKELAGHRNYSSSEFGEHVIHSWSEGKEKKNKKKARRGEKVFAAFVGDSELLITHTEAALMKALEEEKTKGANGIAPPADLNAAILGHINVAAIGEAAEAQIFRSAKAMTFSMGAQANGSLAGEMRIQASDADGAKQLFRMIDGMIAFGGQHAENGWNPDKQMKVTQDGDAINIQIDIPIEDIERIKKSPLWN